MSAVVITPTTGSAKLIDAVYSVRDQTYKNTKHLLVIDGAEYASKIPADIQFINSNLDIVQLKNNVGKNGFYGHRVYAGFSHLVNENYVLFLDEDNWLEKNHVESLISTIEKNKYDWSYSLRNIVDESGSIQDNCESLGRWPVWTSYLENQEKSYHIDTSAYCFKREFIIQVSQLWHFGYGGDRRFYNIIKQHENYGTSGKYTLNYRLDGNETSLAKEFITQGNSIMQQIYKGIFPWIIK